MGRTPPNTRRCWLAALDQLRIGGLVEHPQKVPFAETHPANDRCLTKVIDHMAAAQLLWGWPDHATTATGEGGPGTMHYFLLFIVVRDTLQKASKLQTDVIDKVAEACFASRLI